MKKLMLIYQYAYYAVRESDKRKELSVGFTKMRVNALVSVFESFLLMTIYGWIDIMHGPHLHNLPTSVLIVFPYILVVFYINNRLLGSQERIQHYKTIFDGWDKRKRQRWAYFVASIVLLIFVSFFIVIEVSQKMRQA